MKKCDSGIDYLFISKPPKEYYTTDTNNKTP